VERDALNSCGSAWAWSRPPPANHRGDGGERGFWAVFLGRSNLADIGPSGKGHSGSETSGCPSVSSASAVRLIDLSHLPPTQADAIPPAAVRRPG
jgi:hypothetical protein